MLVLKIAWGIVLGFLIVFFILPIVIRYVCSILNLIILFIVMPLIYWFKKLFIELGRIGYHRDRIKSDLKKDFKKLFSSRFFSFKDKISWSFFALGAILVTISDTAFSFWLPIHNKNTAILILIIMSIIMIYVRLWFMISRLNAFDISLKMKLIVMIGIPIAWILLSLWIRYLFQYQLFPFYDILYLYFIFQDSSNELFGIIPKRSQKVL